MANSAGAGDLSRTLPWNSPTEGSRATPWAGLGRKRRRMQPSHRGTSGRVA